MFGDSVHARLLTRLSRAGDASRCLGNQSLVVPCPLKSSCKGMSPDEFAAFEEIVTANPGTSDPPRAVSGRAPTHPVRRFLEPLATVASRPDLDAKSVLERAVARTDTESYALIVEAVNAEKAARG